MKQIETKLLLRSLAKRQKLIKEALLRSITANEDLTSDLWSGRLDEINTVIRLVKKLSRGDINSNS